MTLLKAGTMLVWFFIFLQCESKTFTKKTFLRRWTEKNWTQLSLEGYRRYHHSCDDNLFQIRHQFFNTFTIIITTAIINKIVILFFIIIITRPKPAYGRQGLAGGSLRASRPALSLEAGSDYFLLQINTHTHTSSFLLLIIIIIIKFLLLIIITFLLLLLIFMIISSWCFLRRGWQTGNRYLNIRNLSARA